MHELLGLLRRIGSPNAVNPLSLWVTLVANLMLVLLSHRGALEPEQLPGRLVSVLVSEAVLLLPPLVVWQLAVRRHHRQRPWLMLGAFLVGAALRGGALVLVDTALGLPQHFSPLYRVLTSCSIMVTILAVVAITVDVVRESVASDTELQHYRAQTRLAAETARQRTLQQREETLQRIDAELERRLGGLDSAAETARRLRGSVEEVVRPLSHAVAAALPEIDVDALRLPPDRRRGWRSLLQDIAAHPPFTPPMAELLLVVAGSPYLLTVAPLGVSALSLLASSLLSIAVCLLANWSFRLRPPRSIAETAVRLTLAATAAGASWLACSWFLLAESGRLQIFWIPVVFSIIVHWLLAGLRAAVRRQQARLTEGTAASDERRRALASARADAWNRGQELAHALHGPLQGTLTAHAIRLELELQSGGTGEAELARLEAALRAALAELSAPPAEPQRLPELLDGLRALWAGIAELEWSVPEPVLARISEDATATVLISRIVQEACSNAVRHGGAVRIAIGLALEGGAARLTITDDGGGLGADPGEPGLGSELLDQTTLDWSLTAREGGAVLTARIALR